MKIIVLSKGSNLYSTKRLFEAGVARGHKMEIIDYTSSYMMIEQSNPKIHHDKHELEDIDAVIPRIGSSRTFFGSAVVRQFEMQGVYSLNSSLSIGRSRDKLRSMQIMSKAHVNIPKTAFASSPSSVDDVIKLVGGAPVVIKILEGTQGVGVVLAETKKAARSVLEAFYGLKVNILIQEFIEESKSSDIRAFVVGKKVVAAMQRTGAEGDFRSNIHRGGSSKQIKLTKEEKSTALGAAKAMGLSVAGVDMLRSNRGPLVMEVNSSPGLEGIEKATGIDVADKIIAYIEEQTSKKKQPKDKVGA